MSYRPSASAARSNRWLPQGSASRESAEVACHHNSSASIPCGGLLEAAERSSPQLLAASATTHNSSPRQRSSSMPCANLVCRPNSIPTAHHNRCPRLRQSQVSAITKPSQGVEWPTKPSSCPTNHGHLLLFTSLEALGNPGSPLQHTPPPHQELCLKTT